MCLSVLAYHASPLYPFILIHNRDEFEARPSQPAHLWTANGILGGKDLKSNGMWLGISPSGRFASITNYRDPLHFLPEAPSRGFLVKDFLMNSLSPSDWIGKLELQLSQLNGFNLFFGSIRAPWFYSSRRKQLISLPVGIHGLSNADLNTPWPKVTRAVGKFGRILSESNENESELIENLFALLRDPIPALPEHVPQTGLSAEAELALSSVFVNARNPGRDYSTRCSTVILVNSKSEMNFRERTFLNGVLQGEADFYFGMKVSSPSA